MSKKLTTLLLIGLMTGALLAKPARNPSAADSALIRQQIDDLLKRRQKPESLPVDPPNPFALTGTGSVTATREPAIVSENADTGAKVIDPADEYGSATTAEILARLAARLRITGMIRIKDQFNIIINDSPWKEGDYLIINQSRRTYRLQVVRIQPGQLTMRLEDAELVLRF